MIRPCWDGCYCRVIKRSKLNRSNIWASKGVLWYLVIFITSNSAGSYHTLFVTSCGNIVVSGWNELGECGRPLYMRSIECCPLNLDLSVKLDISRGTCTVNPFISQSADNTFMIFHRCKEKLRLFILLLHSVNCCHFSDILILS